MLKLDEIEKVIWSLSNQYYISMFYKTGYCFTSKDLFDNFNISRLTTKKKFWGKDCKGDSKLDLVAKVLTYCFYLIILDIINNNITFVLPTVHKEAMIHVKQFTGETFRHMYNMGKFNDIDYLMSNFKGYQIYYRYQYKGGYREKPIYINSALKKIFIDNINKGKQYY